MAKEKLTRTQNETLGQINDLNEKFALLEQWQKEGQISRSLYNSIVNKLINRAMKSVKPSIDMDDRTGYKLAVEPKIQRLIEKLRTNINLYLSERNKSKVKISEKDLKDFQFYINNYPQLKSKVNRLLIVGLRYPDEQLNRICEEYIRKCRLIEVEQFKHADTMFWLMLWEDGNLVPLNAVRLMLVKTGKDYDLSPCFDKHLISLLIPLVEFQRDKEQQRLNWVKTISDPVVRAKENERKQKRLDTFNCLLSLMHKKL
jgi:hypothetical protein